MLNTVIALGIMHALGNVLDIKDPTIRYTFPNGSVYSIESEHNSNWIEVKTTTGETILILVGLALLVLRVTLVCRKWNFCATNKLCN